MRVSKRALVDDYVALAEQLRQDLPDLGIDTAAAVADIAELVRGYEEVKLAALGAYRQRHSELGYPIAATLADLLDR